jgi:hypothetical protein
LCGGTASAAAGETGKAPGEIRQKVFWTAEKIHPSLPEYEFIVYGKEIVSGGSAYFSADTISVHKPGGTLLQEIVFAATRTYNARNFGFVLEDMNFDGYKDIRIQELTSAGPNIPYLCWLWDNAAAQFVRNGDLEKITSPKFDQEHKTITSFVRSSAAHHLEYTYRYLGGVPAVVRIKESKGERIDGKMMVRYVTRELRDGVLEVIEDYTKPYESER